jgi:hypothetical protein
MQFGRFSQPNHRCDNSLRSIPNAYWTLAYRHLSPVVAVASTDMQFTNTSKADLLSLLPAFLDSALIGFSSLLV